jgi:hypothetical protein
LVNFSAGTKDVFVTYPSSKSVNQDASGNVTNAGSITGTNMIASNGLYVNSQTVSASYTIATGNSAMSAGPITVASGQSVTLGSGARWVVI